jgi:DNA-binding LytR/AlgR family response regulator
MEDLKILIVEDEALIADSLRAILTGMGYQVAAIFRSGQETLDKFRPGFADIVIMDINLQGKINGVDTSIELRKMSTVPIIYLTDNQDEYLRKKAIYETNTVQYLTKPFTRLDISVAIDLAIKTLKKHDLKVKQATSASYVLDECIFVKDGPAYKKIMVGDILYVKAERSYCQLVYKDKTGNESTSILFSESLSFLEEKLAFAHQLVRVHRSYLINIQRVHKTQVNRLWIGQEEIPIGKTFRPEVQGMFRYI